MDSRTTLVNRLTRILNRVRCDRSYDDAAVGIDLAAVRSWWETNTVDQDERVLRYEIENLGRKEDETFEGAATREERAVC